MPLNKIPELEYAERITILMESISKKGRCQNHECKEMFRLYNDRLDPHESEGGIFCGACTSRVYKKLKAYYESKA